MWSTDIRFSVLQSLAAIGPALGVLFLGGLWGALCSSLQQLPSCLQALPTTPCSASLAGFNQISFGSVVFHPLHFAAYFGLEAFAQLLLYSPWTDPDGEDATQTTAMHVAAARGQHRIARRLLEAGARPWTRDAYNRTALVLARSTRAALSRIPFVFSFSRFQKPPNETLRAVIE